RTFGGGNHHYRVVQDREAAIDFLLCEDRFAAAGGWSRDPRRNNSDRRAFCCGSLLQRREQRRIDPITDQHAELTASEILRSVADNAQRRRRRQVLFYRPRWLGGSWQILHPQPLRDLLRER